MNLALPKPVSLGLRIPPNPNPGWVEGVVGEALLPPPPPPEPPPPPPEPPPPDGGLPAGVTSIVIIAVLEPPLPSDTVKENVSIPEVNGVYTILALVGLMGTTLPSEPNFGLDAMLNVNESPSLSNPVNVIVFGIPCIVETFCEFAIGIPLTFIIFGLSV